jgi:hypothetical protein
LSRARHVHIELIDQVFSISNLRIDFMGQFLCRACTAAMQSLLVIHLSSPVEPYYVLWPAAVTLAPRRCIPVEASGCSLYELRGVAGKGEWRVLHLQKLHIIDCRMQCFRTDGVEPVHEEILVPSSRFM